ncbi:DUF3558 domain-containing protein [Nocardia nova]|nr:DUF3558 domain-containing protein [Nocardia nova]
MGGRGITAVAAVAIGGALVLGGCGASTDGDAKPAGQGTSSAGPSLAAQAPTGYDGCKDVPQSVRDSEQLILGSNSDAGTHGVEWRGCSWLPADGDGYTVAIRTTNLTIDAIRGKGFQETRELAIGGRRAISSRQFDGPYIKEACTLNVEMRGGTLEFNVNNPASAPRTGSTDSCRIAETLGNKVVSMMPPGA